MKVQVAYDEVTSLLVATHPLSQYLKLMIEGKELDGHRISIKWKEMSLSTKVDIETN